MRNHQHVSHSAAALRAAENEGTQCRSSFRQFTSRLQSGSFLALLLVYALKCGVHQDAREYHCSICNKNFSCSSLISRHADSASSETRIHLLQPKSLQFLFQICTECEEYLYELLMQGHEDAVTTVRTNCLIFYVTAAEEIRKRLLINNKFLLKLQVFRPFVSLFNTDRETSFNDVSFIAKTIDSVDEDALKKEWIALPLDFTMEEKQNLSKLNFDNMWKEILHPKHSNNITKYPNLTNVLNAVRSLPNSNADPERMFSSLSNLKTKNRNRLSSASINATCILKSGLWARGETCLNMMIEEKYLSLMSTDKLYANIAKKKRRTLRLHAVNDNEIAGPSWAR
ncbi:hypothetical protein P5V15_008315 [Pogonomyrmex californicus]